MPSPVHKSAANLFLLACSVVATLGVLELALRVFHPQQQFSVLVTTWDPELGLRQIPGAKGCIVRSEFRTDVVINSKGLRDREYPYARPAGTKRVLCLGDSFTWGFGVDEDQTFAKVLETLLGTTFGLTHRWEVINAGVYNTGTAHQLAYFDAEGYKYDPDVVVLCFCPANDFWNNTSSGLYTLRDGRLIKHTARISRPVRLRCLAQRIPGYSVLFGRSHLVTFIKYRIIARLIYRRHVPDRAGDPRPSLAAEQRAEALTRQLMATLHEHCTSRNCSLAVMVVPEADCSIPQPCTRDLIDYIKRDGIQYVDLSPRFAEEAKQGIDNFYPLDGHWNRTGHRLAAEILYELLVGTSPRRNSGTQYLSPDSFE